MTSSFVMLNGAQRSEASGPRMRNTAQNLDYFTPPPRSFASLRMTNEGNVE